MPTGDLMELLQREGELTYKERMLELDMLSETGEECGRLYEEREALLDELEKLGARLDKEIKAWEKGG
jgi:hypothetical protein